MKIDIFNHFFPKRFFDEFIVDSGRKDLGKRVQNVPTIADLDARFRVMDEFGEYCQLLSLPAPPLEVMAGPEKSPLLARVANDGLAELVTKYSDRFPDVKIITHHLGGMIPYFEGRVGYGWDVLGSRTSEPDYTVLLRSLKKRPVDYFRMFYADTALFGALAATRCGLEFFGIDRVLFASDVPFEPKPGLFIRETIRVIESLGLTADDKDRIYRRNAERLLNLVPSPTS